MVLICLLLGHKYKPISNKKSTAGKRELAKHEYDEIREYQCQRCGKKIIQEEHYQ
ncbi:MAG: hypothetical protein ACXACU_07740 [Candidatus Hodarchaeales archaeon]|jgi:DNA-directed RNA polymerase subunit RPC12/RpoP